MDRAESGGTHSVVLVICPTGGGRGTLSIPEGTDMHLVPACAATACLARSANQIKYAAFQ